MDIFAMVAGGLLVLGGFSTMVNASESGLPFSAANAILLAGGLLLIVAGRGPTHLEFNRWYLKRLADRPPQEANHPNAGNSRETQAESMRGVTSRGVKKS